MIEKEYGIKNKPDSSGNPQANTTTERIHKSLGNLAWKYNINEPYVDDADPWMGLLAAAVFLVRSTYHRIIGKSMGQLVLG